MVKHQLIMVLNDGETFTALSGCRIIAVPEEIEDVEEYLDDTPDSELEIIASF